MANDKNIRIQMKDVRGSFLHVITPQERTNDEGKLTGYNFNANFLIPKTIDGKANPLAIEITEAIKKAIEAKWPGQNKKIGPAERCLIDGEPVDPDTEVRTPLYDGYAGMYVLRAAQGVTIEEWEEHRKNPVQLLGARKNADGKFPRLKGVEAEQMFYSGAYFDVIVTIYAYDGAKRGHKSRVSASLEAVKFKRHGEAFGAAVVVPEDFFDEESDDALDDGIGGGDTNTQSAGVDDLLNV